MLFHHLMWLLAILGVCACTPPAEPTKPVTSAAVVLDQSQSDGDVDRRCLEARARVESLMSRAPFEVVVLGTGSTRTGSEPIVLVRRRSWSGASRMLFKNPRGQQRERETWLSQIEIECRHNFVSSGSSPISRGIERALESLRARELELKRSDKPYVLRLFVHSDMSEGVDPGFLARLSKRRRRKMPALPKLNIDGVDVQICLGGGHVRDGNGDLNNAHALWREVFGSKSLPFDLVCPMPGPKGGRR